MSFFFSIYCIGNPIGHTGATGGTGGYGTGTGTGGYGTTQLHQGGTGGYGTTGMQEGAMAGGTGLQHQPVRGKEGHGGGVLHRSGSSSSSSSVS